MSKLPESKTNPLAILPAQLSEPLRVCSLMQCIGIALTEHADIEGSRFTGDDASGIAQGELSFSGCAFERCVFADWALHRVSFVDCRFSHCDLSGLRLENVALHRVQFENCRLTGTELLRASLMNVTFTGCSADYMACSEGKLNRVRFAACRLRESLWQDIQQKYSEFQDCDLTAAQIRMMPLDGLDFSTCVLDGLQTDPRDLRGLKVTGAQGLAFCALLGLTVVD